MTGNRMIRQVELCIGCNLKKSHLSMMDDVEKLHVQFRETKKQTAFQKVHTNGETIYGTICDAQKKS